MKQPRDYAYEALAEVTNSDQNAARGQLNAALKSIREQSEIEDSYLLSAEIHERAKMYRALFPNAAITPTALAKHWKRVFEESTKKRGTNLHAGYSKPLPPMSHQDNLNEARKLMAAMGWGKGEEDEVQGEGVHDERENPLAPRAR